MVMRMEENKLSKKRKISQRALKEAAERKKSTKAPEMPKEYGGREGLEPTRYNDWEVKGIVTDF